MKGLIGIVVALVINSSIWATPGGFVYFKNLLPGYSTAVVEVQCGDDDTRITLKSGDERFCYSSPSVIYLDDTLVGSYQHDECGIYEYVNASVEINRQGAIEHTHKCIATW